MTDLTSNSTGYLSALESIKKQVRTCQQKAVLSVNKELILLYHYIGKIIRKNQQQQGWGAKTVDALASDLKFAFPEMKGLSRRNLDYMRKFAEIWSDEQILQQLVAKLPWGHNTVLIDKLSTYDDRLWYVDQTIENGWSRAVLVHQIESRLIERQGSAVNNFKRTLPSSTSELAVQTLKDPYNFDFLGLSNEAKEREIEEALMKQVTSFLLELGSGFALVGQQYNLIVGGDDFFIDLLFYHLQLRCYVVVELKADKLKPGDIGQLDFYLAAVDGEIKREDDAPTIGLLLCKERNRVVAEYAVSNKTSPIGIAEYKLNEMLPKELEGQLPSIEELELKLTTDFTDFEKE